MKYVVTAKIGNNPGSAQATLEADSIIDACIEGKLIHEQRHRHMPVRIITVSEVAK